MGCFSSTPAKASNGSAPVQKEATSPHGAGQHGQAHGAPPAASTAKETPFQATNVTPVRPTAAAAAAMAAHHDQGDASDAVHQAADVSAAHPPEPPQHRRGSSGAQELPYHENDPFAETKGEYVTVKELGAGTFGMVVLAKNRDGEEVAVKVWGRPGQE